MQKHRSDYEVKCKKCDRRYIGETARSAFTRGREHWKGIVEKSKDDVFRVQGVEEHGGRVQVGDYEMKGTGVYGDDATKR